MQDLIPGPTARRKSQLAERQTPGQDKKLNFLRDIIPQKLWMAVAILVLGLTITFIASLYIKSEVETAAKKEFDFICEEIRLNIADRLSSSALVLYSGAALYYASDEVTRSDWQIFTSKLRLEQEMPGTQGIGFSLIIPPAQLEQHVQQIRAEGFPDYTVRPEDEREVYTAIIYLEPFSGRNLRAFGYDMYSEPIRRAAMERARDTNSAALSGKVILVQETEEDVQAGALMYVPVYRNGLPVESVEERRAALLGWVYSPYRMNDLMQGALGYYEMEQKDNHVSLQIYDGTGISADKLLFDSRSKTEKLHVETAADISKIIQVNYFGQPWTLKFIRDGGIASLTDYDSFWFFLIGGTSINLLLFGLLISMLRTAHYLESVKLLAEMDGLTGVYNRRKILELAAIEFTRARRNNHNLTILMIDLNFFKQINDSFGHTAGDQALRLTAYAMRHTLRVNIDRIGRFGGDEFIIILPETGLVQAEAVIARLQVNAAEHTAHIAPGLSPVSLSIGAAELNAATPTIEQLVERADQAMYIAKKHARRQEPDPG